MEGLAKGGGFNPEKAAPRPGLHHCAELPGTVFPAFSKFERHWPPIFELEKEEGGNLLWFAHPPRCRAGP
ncbi:MAG: hypothetical protein CM15mP103_00880 [Gammaproteobacteria bacterium]|nr:MAG: hypothetical protein CM15mP103_00880 [Gammaproteobacteria bacterium]